MFIFSFIKYEYFTHSLVFTHLGGIDQGRARAVDCKLAALLSQSGRVQLPADYPTTLTPPEITKIIKKNSKLGEDGICSRQAASL